MEGSSFSVSLKDRSVVTRDMEGDHQSSKKNLMSLWGCSTKENYPEEDYLNGFSWPPRSYTCSFCKREFKSAQALGGHMNVHRRDRARLRQSPPLEAEQNLPQPSPNLNTFSTFSAKLDLSPNPLPSLISIPLLSLSSSSTTPNEIRKCPTIKMKVSDVMKTQKAKPALGVGEDVVSVEKDISFLGDSKEDLDLELRLGYL